MTPWVFVLLALASWRTWALISRDTILDPVRDWIAPKRSPARDWLECPYCSGFWVAGGWVTAWDCFGTWSGFLWWAVSWWALAAAVIVIETVVDKL